MVKICVQCRSHSNHRCCYDARYRGAKTRHLTESSGSSMSGTSSASKRKRRSSSGSKNDSSGYGCSISKTSRTEGRNKRHRPISHDVSPRKSRRHAHNSKADVYTDRPYRDVDRRHDSSDIARFNGDRGSGPGRDVRVGSRYHQPSACDHATSHVNGFNHNGDGAGVGDREHAEDRSVKGSGIKMLNHRDGRKRLKRSKEREQREKSHAHHERRKETPVVPIGDLINHRFEVRKVLGEGSFGQVLECLDHHTQARVAVKSLKRLEDYQEAAKHEVNVLDTIAKADRSSRSHCIVTVDFFAWHKHFYIVFPLLGASVFTFLEQNDYEPYPIEHAASITLQLCEAVNFMHRMGICHTDLKPENILFISGEHEEVYSDVRGRYIKVVKDTRIQVIDFGSATNVNERHATVIQTRHYRAPEVILETGWSFPADVWSLGSILYELVTGSCLFMTHDNLEHLAMMERVLGPLPRGLIKASRRRRYFHHDRLDWDPESSGGRYVRRHLKPLGDLWQSSANLDTRLAFDLVRSMLVYDQKLRISSSQALEHPFLLSFAEAV